MPDLNVDGDKLHYIEAGTAATQGISNHVRQPRFAITAESASASSSRRGNAAGDFARPM